METNSLNANLAPSCCLADVIGEDRDGETEQIGGEDIEAEVSGALVTGLEEIG